jgi:hypothetical protein
VSFTLRNAQQQATNSASQITITKPTGLAVGDLMVAVIGKDDDVLINLPSGWSSPAGLWQGTSSGNDLYSRIFYKVADAADVAASNFTWTFGDSGEDCTGTLAAFIPSNSNPAYGSSSTPVALTLAPPAGSLVIGGCVSAQAASGGLGVATSGFTVAGGSAGPTTGAANGDNGSIMVYDLSHGGGNVAIEYNNAETTAESHPYALYFTDDAVPVVEQKAFRFRDDDDDEANAAWLAALNTDINLGTSATFRLRLLLENDGTAALDTTTDWQLQYSYNSGTWTNVTAATTHVKSIASSHVTDGEATTQQLGSGTFEAGEIEEANGVVEDSNLPTATEIEHEWVLQTGASLSIDDTLDFRVLYAGDPPDTMTQTPRVTIILPGIISGVDGPSSSEYNWEPGPFYDPTNDRLYVVMHEDDYPSNANTELKVVESGANFATDPWTVKATSAPASLTNFRSLTAIHDVTARAIDIIALCVYSAATHIRYWRYTIPTSSWSVEDELVTTAATANSSQQAPHAIKLSNGQLLVLYLTAASSAKTLVVTRRTATPSWTSPVTVHTEATNPMGSIRLVKGANVGGNDAGAWILYQTNTEDSQKVRHYDYDGGSDTIGSEYTIGPTGNISSTQMPHSVELPDVTIPGHVRVYWPTRTSDTDDTPILYVWDDLGTDVPQGIRSESPTDGTDEALASSTNMYLNFFVHSSGGRLAIMFVRASDYKIRYDQRIEIGGAWGTDTDQGKTLSDGSWSYARTFVKSGTVYLGILARSGNDESNDWFYYQVSLGAESDGYRKPQQRPQLVEMAPSYRDRKAI